MIKNSAAAGLTRTGARDALRANARAARAPGRLDPTVNPPSSPQALLADPGAAIRVGDYQLDVDDAGALVAVHLPTGHTRVLVDLPGAPEGATPS